MRLSLTVTHPASGRSADLAIEVDPASPIGAVASHAADLLQVPLEERTSVYIGAEQVDAASRVIDTALIDGAELAIGVPRPYSRHPFEHLPSLRIVSGVGAGTVFYLCPGPAVLGRDLECTLRVGDPEVPDFAAWLATDEHGAVTLTPAQGVEVRIGGEVATATALLAPETEIRVGNTLFELALPRASDAALTRSDTAPRLDYARPPRLLPPERESHFKLPQPPSEPSRRPIPLVAALAPIPVAAVMAIILSPTMLLFAVMSPVMLFANFFSDRKRGKKTYRQQLIDYEALRVRIEADADEAMGRERVERRREAPDAAALLEIAVGLRARLWERRRTDGDYLNVRIGTADLPSEVVLEDPEEKLEHRRTQARIATDVPVVLSLQQQGVIGIAGAAPATQNLASWMLGQIGVLQSPRDTSVVVLTDSRSAAAWAWLRWLPHARPDSATNATALVGNDAETLARRVAELGQIIDARRRIANGKHVAFADPDIVVVIDGARRLRALPGLIRILKDGPSVGVFAICIDADARLLPEECTAVVKLGPTSADVIAQRADDVRDARTDILPPAWFAQVARALAPVVDINDDVVAGALPASSRLVEVLDLDPPTENAIVARWRAGGRTTEVVVGESLDGAFSFDLRRDGPHGLVAGTTGSGKSELLQTIVASLAVANRPDAMTFVLVDYKGGAAFKDCVALPHTVGMVTDLDTHLVERALESLGAELRRREHALAAIGAKDIEDYTELQAKDRTIAPLPRLLIVIDEFASMVRELPDFVTGLVNIAQRGRSLGIHLILATQRPSGVVTPEIRANTNLRIALRVTDAGESTDVIDAPDSAQISKNTPGRGYIRLGASALLPFQSGRVGGKRLSTASAPTQEIWSSEIRWDDLGRPPAEPPRAEQRSEEETDLQALVVAIRAANDRLGLPPQHQPWIEALGDRIVFDDINDYPLDDASDGWSIPPLPYGVQDLPALQEQRTAFLDLDTAGHLFVAGAARSGRSQLLRTLAGAIARNTSAADVHVYALDCGNGALIPLGDMPHTGAVVLRSQTERAQRLLARLVQEAQSRQDVLAAGGYAGVTEQRQSVPATERLPHIVLLLDRWEGFLTSLGELDGGAMVDQVTLLLREGASLGIHLVVTGDRQLLSSRIGTLVEDKLVLRLSDRSDYSYAGLNAKNLPETVGDGRAFTSDSGIETQIALLAEDPSGQSQSAALGRLAELATRRDASVPRARRPFRLDVLPAKLPFEDAWNLRDTERDDLWAMVGVGGDELLAMGPDLDRGTGTFLLAGPPKSGKSTVLLTMARSIARQGGEVVVLAPRQSPLRELAGETGIIAVIDDAEVSAERLEELLPPSAARRVLIVDDAELVKDTDAKPWFQAYVRSCADRAQAIIAGGTLGEIANGLTGWQVDMKRSRRGALLSPSSTMDGDLFGSRIPRSALSEQVQPGKAILNLGGGELVTVQVPVG